MGMLDETGQYPFYDMSQLGATLVGTVWGPPQEKRQMDTKFGKADFYWIHVLPDGKPAGEENVVTLSVPAGGRLAAISAAVKKAGAKDIEEGGRIAVKFASTKPSQKGNDQKIWEAQYVPPAKSSGGMLSEAAASDEMNLLG